MELDDIKEVTHCLASLASKDLFDMPLKDRALLAVSLFREKAAERNVDIRFIRKPGKKK